MDIISTLVYILSGYGIVSLTIIIKLLVSLTRIEYGWKTDRDNLQRNIDRLEHQMERYDNGDISELSEQVSKLSKIIQDLNVHVDGVIDGNSTNDDKKLLKG